METSLECHLGFSHTHNTDRKQKNRHFAALSVPPLWTGCQFRSQYQNDEHASGDSCVCFTLFREKDQGLIVITKKIKIKLKETTKFIKKTRKMEKGKTEKST
jgi:hypothetical protein